MMTTLCAPAPPRKKSPVHLASAALTPAERSAWRHAETVDDGEDSFHLCPRLDPRQMARAISLGLITPDRHGGTVTLLGDRLIAALRSPCKAPDGHPLAFFAITMNGKGDDVPLGAEEDAVLCRLIASREPK